jgi:type I restriction enzyme M protein
MSLNPATRPLLDAARADSSQTLDAVVAPLAVLVALRWADVHDAEQEAMAAFNREEPRLILPAGLRWAVWSEAPRPLTAGDIADLWGRIRSVIELPTDLREPHHKVRPPSDRLLSAMVAWVNALSLDTPAARQKAGEAFTDVVSQALDLTRFGGELITPRTAGRLMIALADPRPGERIYDPCFGTGGLLVEAAEALWFRGREIAPGEWSRAQLVPLFGVERQPDLHLVAFVRLLLAGVRPALEFGDALEREAASRHQDQGFDCVFVDPPWGMKVEGAQLYNFAIRSSTSENMFSQHAVRSLREGGRAILSVPPGLLDRGGADYELRKWLLTDYCVEAVIRFPNTAFRGLRSTPPALVLVRKAPPAKVVRFLELVSLPDTVTDCRNLVRELLSGGDVSPHSVREVRVSELLKMGAQLTVPTELEIAGSGVLASLATKVDLVALGEVVQLVMGVPVARQAVTDHPVEGALPLLRISDLIAGVVRIGERYLLPSDRPPRPEQFVRAGDVLLSVDGTIGKVQHVRTVLSSSHEVSTGPEEIVGIAQKGLVILRPTSPSLDARFLAAVLSSDTLQALLRRLARGVTIAHLPLQVLRKVKVPVPPPAVQERVLRRLSDQPGDALEALRLVLAGHDEDPLTRLFRENPVLSRLASDAVPEASELRNLSFEALRELRHLRNEVVHRPDQSNLLRGTTLTGDAIQFLLVLGSVPAQALRRGGEASLEAASATQALVSAATPIVKRLPGGLGRYASRLTERLALWVEAERAALLAQVRLTVEHNDRDFRRDPDGVGHTTLRVTLQGAMPLRTVVVRVPDLLPDERRLEELQPGQSFELDVTLTPDLKWQGHESGGGVRRPLYWSAEGPDGEPLAGEADAQVWFLWSDWGPHGPFEPAPGTAPSPRRDRWLDYGNSPYVAGDVIDEPGMFFGRQAVLADIQTHIGGGTKVILLEGNRRTGKTSILRQLQRPGMRLVDRWIMVESNFQGTVGDALKNGIPTEGVFRMLVRDIGFACAKAGAPVLLPGMSSVADLNMFRFHFAKALNTYFDGIDPYEALQIYIDMVTATIAPRRLLLMLDEFDKLQVGIDNHVTSPQVPENIRNLLQTRSSVAAIITGARRLKRLREEYWSALFGFGHRIGVDPLAPSEVADLVTRPVEGRLAFSEDAIQAITQETARQPYLVQSLCARIFELAKWNKWRRIRATEVNEAASRMVHDNEHFQALWRYAETERRRYLLWLCHRLADEPHRVNAALLTQRLEEAGVIVPVDLVDDDLKFLIELELVVLNNTALGPQYELAIPLMRRWMNENVDAEAQRRRAVHEAQIGAKV